MLRSVWRACEEDVGGLVEGWKGLIGRCYPVRRRFTLFFLPASSHRRIESNRCRIDLNSHSLSSSSRQIILHSLTLARSIDLGRERTRILSGGGVDLFLKSANLLISLTKPCCRSRISCCMSIFMSVVGRCVESVSLSRNPISSNTQIVVLALNSLEGRRESATRP